MLKKVGEIRRKATPLKTGFGEVFEEKTVHTSGLWNTNDSTTSLQLVFLWMQVSKAGNRKKVWARSGERFVSTCFFFLIMKFGETFRLQEIGTVTNKDYWTKQHKLKYSNSLQ